MARLLSVLGVLWMAVALYGQENTAATEPLTATSETPTVSVTDGTTPTEGATHGTEATAVTSPTDASATTAETSPTDASAATAETSPTDASAATAETSPTDASATTAETPGTGETQRPPQTDKPPSTPKPTLCDPNPCGGGSTCEARANNTYICLCLPGDSYNEAAKVCQKVKVFPGKFTQPGFVFQAEMSDKTSEAFSKASDKIITEMFKAFESDTNYLGCIVLEIGKQTARMTRNDAAEASVDLNFNLNSDITQKKVVEKLKATCETCLFADIDLCERGPCDQETTKCISSEASFSCLCQEGYIKSDFTDRVCLACPSGQQSTDSGCSDCKFGYSGFNCEENWLLILVIVGSVLGGLLIIFLIALIVVSVKSPKKKIKKSKEPDVVKPYVSHFSTKVPLGGSSIKNDYTSQASAPAGVPRIPRATTTSTLDNRSNIEMVPNNSRQNLISSNRNSWLSDDQDGPYSYSRPNNSYAQARPQSNPYNQNRAQYNPYAPSQGHSNPYYKD